MRADIAGIDTNYQFFAKKNAPTVILLHGWLNDWQAWSSVIQPLSNDFQLVVPDLPGFGASTFIEKPWLQTRSYAQWLATFITYLKLDTKQPVIVIGHSFGGKVAALYAAHYQNTSEPPVSKIILVDAAGMPDDLPTKTVFKQSLIRLIPKPLKHFLPQSLKYRILDKMGVATDHLQSNRVQRQVLQATIRENISADVTQITLPTLLVWGQHDEATPLHQGYDFHVKIPSAKLEIFEKSGHFPFQDEPKKFIETITTFINA